MKSAILIATLGLIGTLQASVITINYADSASLNPAAVGNIITRTNGLFQVQATGWELNSSNLWAQGRLHDWGTSGLGICTASETSSSGCSASGDPSEHRADNAGNREAVLFQFSNAVTGQKLFVTNISVTFGNLASDWDVSYWTGNTNNAFSPSSLLNTNISNLGTAGFNSRVDINNGPTSLVQTSGIVTVNLNNTTGFNSFLFGPSFVGSQAYLDGFKVRSISFTVDPTIPGNEQVPEPGTYVLLGAGLLGIGLMRRKK